MQKVAGEQLQRLKVEPVQSPKSDQSELDKNQNSKTGVKTEGTKTESKRAVEIPENGSKDDLDSLWHKIFEDGEAVKGSFNLIRTGTTLKEINDAVFKIEAITEIKKNYVMDNKLGLEHLMEKHTGKMRILECCVPGSEKSQKTVKELKNRR